MTADPVIRQIRPDEWPEAKALRLAALRDPAAPLRGRLPDLCGPATPGTHSRRTGQRPK
ncbi:hypothetical protein RCO28_09870 [Streptomyces sp. LHD-70]|uniref:hypothetical protein n=1 Tax=Streptomyces sp. LHD-70 TaxID=3072140 RepID=UPI00280F4CD1|nr:hypothetical protein [Streptomyces sp. LHD-70]MDQ8702795.1 hypothetical protein [Streptomyces sp. LHD-70]